MVNKSKTYYGIYCMRIVLSCIVLNCIVLYGMISSHASAALRQTNYRSLPLCDSPHGDTGSMNRQGPELESSAAPPLTPCPGTGRNCLSSNNDKSQNLWNTRVSPAAAARRLGAPCRRPPPQPRTGWRSWECPSSSRRTSGHPDGC